MPGHVTAVYLTIALVPLASVLTCVYALSARSRRRMRLPTVLAAVAALTAVVWAAGEGPALLDHVERTATASRAAAANAHALASANLFYATGAMLALVLISAWWVLRPAREPSALSRVASTLLVVAAGASLVALALVAQAGATAVWAAT